MRYPKFLKDYGTIGFAAPAFGCNIEPYKSGFKAALDNFSNRGYKCIVGENAYKGDGIGISSTPQSCAKELSSMYLDDKCDVIISCGGGELMCEVVNYIDFQQINNAKPKFFMGYSDNTNFTFLLTTLCDVASIYGPCAATFGMSKWHDSIDDAYKLISGRKSKISGYDKWEMTSLKSEDNPTAPYNLTETKKLIYNTDDKKASFSGRLIGGCLDCLTNLTGTKFDKVREFNAKYKEDGIIWFLESCDLNVMSIRRSLWNLDNCGWFENVKGFIIGRPMHFDEPMFGLDQYRAVTGILDKYNVPIIMDSDIGHLPPAMPLICGSYAYVDANFNDISIDMSF